MVKPSHNLNESSEEVPSQEENGGANGLRMGIEQLFPCKIQGLFVGCAKWVWYLQYLLCLQLCSQFIST